MDTIAYKEGKVIVNTNSCVIIQLEDGMLIRHDKAEDAFTVGDKIFILGNGKYSFYKPATNGHTYLTADYVSREGESVVKDDYFICKPEEANS